jgi:ribosomal protein L11 methyltransferase
LELAVAEESRGAVLDVGAGSGVLAIAAVKLGYHPVRALDKDRESITAIIENANINDVEVEACRFDLRSDALPEIDGLPAPILLANLLKPLLYSLSSSICRAPQHVIASGLLRGEADGVASEFSARHGLRERRRLERGDWAALWLACD